jgi:predicted PolB exonuclease-like 3'-5' exonuclease
MTISNVLAFDIETVPDVEFGRRHYGLEGLTEKQIGYVMQTRQREQTGSDFLSLEQHRIVAISAAMRTREGFKVWSLGDPGSPEDDLVRRFHDTLERQSPTLVSWNGSGFDLPVLNYRAMRHRIQAHRYWEMGDEDPSFKWNNYVSRFHWRHIDLMDVLSGFQGRGRVGLDSMAVLLGLPGKLGMSGEKVWEAHLSCQSEQIRRYCETDALNTYLIYLRFELLRGRLTHDEHDRECARVRETLQASGQAHLLEFAAAWPGT